MRRRPALSVASISALVMAGLAVPLAGAPTARADAPRTATLVGTLQDELGCSGDWQPDCTKTDLALVPGTSDVCRRVPGARGQLRAQGRDQPLVGRELRPGQRQRAARARRRRPPCASPTTTRRTPSVSHPPTSPALPRRPTRSSRPRRCATSRRRSASTSSWPTASPTATRPTTSGGLTGGPLSTGFDPTNEGFYHGGDLKGLTSKLDYIKGLGTTAIWLTPSFKNRAVQGSGSDASAGYHGYWITDFTQVDPHLGTNADMKTLISAAHAKGMKVYFDIITNHTADVISYDGGTYTYVNKADEARTRTPRATSSTTPPSPASRPARAAPRRPTASRRCPRPRRSPTCRRSPTPTRTSRSPPGSTTRRSTTTAATRRMPASPPRTATSPASTTSSPRTPRSSRAWRTSTSRGSTSGSTASASTPSST